MFKNKMATDCDNYDYTFH